MRYTKRPEYGTIGSISSGTLRIEDLYDAFLWECNHLRLSRAERNTVRAITSTHTVGAIKSAASQTHDDLLDEAVTELQTILENHAAPYMYFGSHYGDGADFGYWLSMDIEQDFDGLRVTDTSEVPKDYRGEVMHVNDHGNMTLYVKNGTKLKEVWSVV